jgi:hypothetical protein
MMAPPRDGEQRLRARERFAPSAVMFASVHEPCVRAERDVVEEETATHPADVDALLSAGVEGSERGDGIVADEAGVACEVVARSEGNADEACAGLERGRRDRSERPVAAGHTQDLGPRPERELPRIVSRLEEMRLDPALPGCRGQLVRARRSTP